MNHFKVKAALLYVVNHGKSSTLRANRHKVTQIESI